jgi:serine/threonine-protein phosphatase 2A regulatory subunit A
MTKYIEPILYFYLKDRTYSVRELALGKLKSLVQTYKMEWVNSSLLPKLAESSSKENGYLIRITALYSLQVKNI